MFFRINEMSNMRKQEKLFQPSKRDAAAFFTETHQLFVAVIKLKQRWRLQQLTEGKALMQSCSALSPGRPDVSITEPNEFENVGTLMKNWHWGLCKNSSKYVENKYRDCFSNANLAKCGFDSSSCQISMCQEARHLTPSCLPTNPQYIKVWTFGKVC